MITLKRKPDFNKNFYEHEAWAQNNLVCGVDEVGRSCLAGPIVAAAVILKPHAKHRLLKDSKLLTPQERLKVYKWLMRNSAFAVGIMHHRLIDTINIYQATLCAMKRAVVQLLAVTKRAPAVILVDAMPVKITSEQPVIYFCHGERKSSSIAAASIIAKVTRDALMQRLEPVIPGYNFIENKGYGTLVHRKAVITDGSSLVHRNSFLNNIFQWDKKINTADIV